MNPIEIDVKSRYSWCVMLNLIIWPLNLNKWSIFLSIHQKNIRLLPKSQRVTFYSFISWWKHTKTSLFSSQSYTFAILYLFDIYVCHNLILSVNTFPVTIFGLHRFFMHIYVSPLIILLLVEACKCQEIETGAFIKFQLHHFEVWKCIFMELI